MIKIPVCSPWISENDHALVEKALLDTQISGTAPIVAEFEKKWAEFCGKRHGIAVCNGTIALEMAVKAYDFPRGSEIIVPAFTIISCLTAIVDAGCVPVLVDCYPDTWTMDISQVRKKITEKTVAIMPVHIYGAMVDMTQFDEICWHHGIYVIEDASEAHGASYGRHRAGQHSDVSVFSFYANKIVSCGEGGMILCDEGLLADKFRYMRDLSQSKIRRFAHHELGHNYRLGALQAALGLGQISHISQTIALKKQIAGIYSQGLYKNAAIQLPIGDGIHSDTGRFLDNVYWMYGIVLKHGYDAEGVGAVLAQRGIETRPFFLGLHEQPISKRMGLFPGESYPVTEMLGKCGLYLPSGPMMQPDWQDYVISTIKEVVR